MVSIRKQVIAMAKNVRGAGRKKALTDEQLQMARELHGQGTSITDLAVQFGVSRQTMSGYLTVQTEQLDEDRQRVRLFSYWKKLNEMFRIVSGQIADEDVAGQERDRIVEEKFQEFYAEELEKGNPDAKDDADDRARKYYLKNTGSLKIPYHL